MRWSPEMSARFVAVVVAACGTSQIAPPLARPPARVDGTAPHDPVTCPQRTEAGIVPVKAVDQLEPVLAIADPVDRAFAIGLRNDALNVACEHHGWNTRANRCMKEATGRSELAACVALLLPEDRRELAARIAGADDRLRETIAVHDRGTPIDCAAVIEARYGAAEWTGMLTRVVGVERETMIRRSAELMMKTCKAVSWSPLLRACIVSGGAGDCFAADGLVTTGWRSEWTYPPMGVIVPTGVPSCDAMETAIESTPCLTDPGTCVIHHLYTVDESDDWARRGLEDPIGVSAECKQIEDAVQATR